MSQVYATEPSTSGRVIFETTHGPLEVQLWCRECPLTTKLFLQLCLDGFYDEMIFHRIVPGFAIQTGAIRQSPASQAAMNEAYRQEVHAQEALDRRKYEVHSRLRFNHRGQVAMALGVEDNDNATDEQQQLQPQFYITLDEAPYLDGKHVLFGTITGPTMFNALRIGRTDVDEATNQPSDLEHAPRITSVKIVDNPMFPDLVPQDNVPWKEVKQSEEPAKKKKRKRKGKKDVNVLSFGNEFEDEEGMDGGGGIKSSHDVVSNQTSLSNRVDEKVKEAVTTAGNQVVVKKNVVKEQDQVEISEDKPTAPMAIARSDEIKVATAVKPAQPSTVANGSHHLEKKKPPPEEAKKPKKPSAIEARLAKYKNLKASKSSKQQREEDTMAKLSAFQGKVRKQISGKDATDQHEDNDLAAKMARKLEQQQPREETSQAVPSYRGQVLENSDDEETQGGKDSWLTTKFKCRKHMDLDSGAGADGRTMDDYRVVDEGHRDDRKRRKHSKHHRRGDDRKRYRR